MSLSILLLSLVLHGFTFQGALIATGSVRGSSSHITETDSPVAASRTSSAQRGSSISGHIFNTVRRPVEKLRVELLDDVGATLSTTLTDGSGRYVFDGLPSGVFQVRVLTHGTNYVSQTERVTISNFNSPGGLSSGFIQVHFTLRSNEPAASSVTANPSTVFAQDVPAAARKTYEQATKDLANLKTTEAGIAGLKKAIDIFPDYYMALETLGTEYVKRGEYEPARIVLTKAVEVNSGGHLSLYALGIAQYHLKQTAAAIDALRRCTTLASNSVNSRLWLGIALLRDGKLDKAEIQLKRAYELGGKRVPDVHMYLAQIYSNSKRYKEAATELELFLKEAPSSTHLALSRTRPTPLLRAPLLVHIPVRKHRSANLALVA